MMIGIANLKILRKAKKKKREQVLYVIFEINEIIIQIYK